MSNTDFQYDETYFNRHYSSSLYRRYIAIRNRFIWREVTQRVPSGRFLEIGFGDDNLLKFFRGEFDVFGIDVAEFAIESLPETYNRSHFAICDVAEDPIPFKGEFDVICTVNTVEHLADPRFALRNVANSLRENGILAIYLPTASNPLSRLQYKLLYDVKEHIYRPSVTALRRLLRAVGLNRREEHAAQFIPLKIRHRLILESFSLYFGIWQKE